MKLHKKAFAFTQTKTAALITAVLLLAVSAAVGCSGNEGDSEETITAQASAVTDGASLILSPDKLTIKVTATTADDSAVTVEGCTETTLASGTETTLHAQSSAVILKGKITELYCDNNQLTTLNVQGLSDLQKLYCAENQLTVLNVQGLSTLRVLDCNDNQLTVLNVQDLSVLQVLKCGNNQLTALNVQGLSALQLLDCSGNQLTSLNVHGLNALQKLYCEDNQLAALNVQDLSILQGLVCNDNQLTVLNVQGLSALRKLGCQDNQLTFLNIQGLSALQWLLCHNNRLTAQALTDLLTDLPARSPSDDAKCTLYSENPEEGNHTDFTAPAELYTAFQDAKTKNWKLYNRDADRNDVKL